MRLPPERVAVLAPMVLSVLGCREKQSASMASADAGFSHEDTLADSARTGSSHDAAGGDVADFDSSANTCAPAAQRAPGAVSLKLTPSEFGIDGVVETYQLPGPREQGRLVVQLRPTGGTKSHVILETGGLPSEPLLQAARFGDAATSSIVVAYRFDIGGSGHSRRHAVIDVHDGQLTRSRARHVSTQEERDVYIYKSIPGTGVDAIGDVFASTCGFELLQLRCDAWWPKVKTAPARCDSTNTTFFVRGGRWYWAERRSDDCVPGYAGTCKPPSPFPDRSAFPTSNPPTK